MKTASGKSQVLKFQVVQSRSALHGRTMASQPEKQIGRVSRSHGVSLARHRGMQEADLVQESTEQATIVVRGNEGGTHAALRLEGRPSAGDRRAPCAQVLARLLAEAAEATPAGTAFDRL